MMGAAAAAGLPPVLSMELLLRLALAEWWWLGPERGVGGSQCLSACRSPVVPLHLHLHLLLARALVLTRVRVRVRVMRLARERQGRWKDHWKDLLRRGVDMYPLGHDLGATAQ